jgi:hypothetical protein
VLYDKEQFPVPDGGYTMSSTVSSPAHPPAIFKVVIFNRKLKLVTIFGGRQNSTRFLDRVEGSIAQCDIKYRFVPLLVHS